MNETRALPTGKNVTRARVDFGEGSVALFEELRDLMCRKRVLGVSAPAIGVGVRAFVIGDPTNPAQVIACFNPTIVDESKEQVEYEEGCVCHPGLFVKVKRPASIRARFANERGDVDTFMFRGLTARAFLHEMDHLDGHTLSERAHPAHMDAAKRQQKKLVRARKNSLRNTSTN